MPHTRFTKEFQDEAVRLALTSGRSRREVAADLGVGLSTLRHWIDRRREREILKRATAFFAKEGSR